MQCVKSQYFLRLFPFIETTTNKYSAVGMVHYTIDNKGTQEGGVRTVACYGELSPNVESRWMTR